VPKGAVGNLFYFILDFYKKIVIILSMNYNYPYLAGYLESTLKMLATDYDFLALKDSESRQNYVQSRIKEAHESMLKNPN
jgi:hypothetical protein